MDCSPAPQKSRKAGGGDREKQECGAAKGGREWPDGNGVMLRGRCRQAQESQQLAVWEVKARG